MKKIIHSSIIISILLIVLIFTGCGDLSKIKGMWYDMDDKYRALYIEVDPEPEYAVMHYVGRKNVIWDSGECGDWKFVEEGKTIKCRCAWYKDDVRYYSYEFDDKGNWILTPIIINDDGTITETGEAKIRYTRTEPALEPADDW